MGSPDGVRLDFCRGRPESPWKGSRLLRGPYRYSPAPGDFGTFGVSHSLKVTSMTDTERALIRLSGALAASDRNILRLEMERARDAAPRSEVEEVILQSYLFLGFPVALNAFSLWRRVSGQPAAEVAESDEDEWDAWTERGERVLGAVYGGQYEALRSNIRELHPDMERWMVAEGYGKVLGRPGLGLRTRELCIAALLAVLGAPKQLYSHLRGALNVGADPEEVREALKEVEEMLEAGGAELRTSAWKTWDRVLAKSQRQRG